MGLNSPLLNLDLNPPYVPEAISEFLPNLSFSDDNNSDKLSKLNDYIHGLQDELRKIEAFKREFPLSLLLLKDVIDYLKEEAKKCREKELTPLKNNPKESGRVESETDPRDKKSWMSTAQLWSTNCQSSFLQLNSKNEGKDDRMEYDNMYETCKYNDSGGAFPSFKESSSVPPPSMKGDAENLTPPALSLTIQSSLKNQISEPGAASGGYGGGGVRFSYRPALNSDQVKLHPKLPNPPFCPARKQRRSWSPELHRRFLDALEKLGGSQVATPKQIRELMQVDGLTNDEVKSHLQKYRLHVRKFQAASPTSSNEMFSDQGQHLEGPEADIQQSGSPDGPLQLTRRSGNCCNSSGTGGDSIEEDQKSDGHHSWKIHHQ